MGSRRWPKILPLQLCRKAQPVAACPRLKFGHQVPKSNRNRCIDEPEHAVQPE
jgi:hypothetical protein